MREWFVNIAGESYASALMWTVAALILLLILLILIRIVRSFTFGTFVAGGRNRRPRLAVTDATAVDSHRRLVLVRRDDVEHLILIGGPSDIVIEQNIREISEEPAFRTEEEKPRQEPAPVPAPVDTPAPATREAPREEIRPVSPSAPAPAPAPTVSAPSTAPTAQSATVVPLKSEPVLAAQTKQDSLKPQAANVATAAAMTAAPRSTAPDDRGDVEIDESVFELAEAEIAAPAREGVAQGRQVSSEPVIRAAPAAASAVAAPAVEAGPAQSDETAYSEPMLDDIDIGTEEARESRKQSDESLEDEMSRLLEELSDNRR